MESPALVAALAAGAGAAVALLLVAVVLTVTRRRRSRVDLEAMLAAAQRECDDLRHRLEELTGTSADGRDAPGGPTHVDAPYAEGFVPRQRAENGQRVPQQAEFVITHVGDPDEEVVAPVHVPDRLVLSATVGEPLVKVAAFSHGVRRALRAESRNRIWFEMRREVRAARKRRRRLVKDYLRETRARDRANEGMA